MMNQVVNITVNYEDAAPLFLSCRTDLIPQSSSEKSIAQTILIKFFNIPSDDSIYKISFIEYFSPVKVISTGELKEINLSGN